MTPRLRWTSALLLCMLLALIATSGASATFTNYLNAYLTQTYSDNCYYATSEGCSGFAYWKYNIVQTGQSDSSGTYVLAGFDNTTTIRGVRMYASQGPLYVTTAQLNMNAYAQAMSILWVGTYMYVNGVACTSPDC